MSKNSNSEESLEPGLILSDEEKAVGSGKNKKVIRESFKLNNSKRPSRIKRSSDSSNSKVAIDPLGFSNALETINKFR